MSYSYHFKGELKSSDDLLEVAQDANTESGISGLTQDSGGECPRIPIPLVRLSVNTAQLSEDIIAPEGDDKHYYNCAIALSEIAKSHTIETIIPHKIS